MAKVATAFAKGMAVVFTAVVAPVVVHNVKKDDKVSAAAPPRAENAAPPPVKPAAASAPAATPPAEPTPFPPAPLVTAHAAVVPPASAAPDVTQVLVTGVGKTPADALKDAFNKALYRAAAAQVGPTTWAAHEQTLWAALGADGGDLIRGWRDVGGRKEWTLRGTLHHRELAVDVDRATVAARLRAALDRPLPDGWR